MARRFLKVVSSAFLAFLLPGCMEVSQTITLNPDGKGKMTIEKTSPATMDMAGNMMGAVLGGGGEPKMSVEEVRKNAAKAFLSDAQGVSAFKDVSATWLRDGRLKVVGTVYFEKLSDRTGKLAELEKDLKKDPENIDPMKMMGMFGNISSLFTPPFEVTPAKDGTMRISIKKQDDKDAKTQSGKEIADMFSSFNLFRDKEKPVDITKMSDKELEEYLLEMRVAYAMLRPMMNAMFNDMKFKIALHLPGEVGEVKGFKSDGKGQISVSIDGAEITGMMNKLLTMEPADARKFAQSKDAKDLSAFFGTMPEINEVDFTVRNVGAPLFDYDKEVRDARAAYPALRKSLGLDDKLKLPGDGK